jgi:hypothetical protein
MFFNAPEFHQKIPNWPVSEVPNNSHQWVFSAAYPTTAACPRLPRYDEKIS